MTEEPTEITPAAQPAGDRRKKLIASAVAVIAVAGGGAAIAATQLDSPSAKSSRIVADAAGQLGVTPTKLTDALKTAYENEIAAELKAGQITQAKADALKAQIEAGNVPLAGALSDGRGMHDGMGMRGGFGHGGPGGHLTATATYLGVKEADLLTQLQGGKSLADVAKTEGKTVDGLVAALVDSEKTELDAAVKAGNLTQTQEDQITANLKTRVTDEVNGVRHTGGPGGFDGPGGFGGPRGFGGHDDGDGPGGAGGGTIAPSDTLSGVGGNA